MPCTARKTAKKCGHSCATNAEIRVIFTTTFKRPRHRAVYLCVFIVSLKAMVICYAHERGVRGVSMNINTRFSGSHKERIL